MEEYSKFTGKSVEDAVLEASIALGTTRENIDYRILEHETKGFLGIGAKKAVIEARKKVSFEDSDIIKEVFSEKSTSSKKNSGKKSSTDSAPKAEKKVEKKAEKPAPEKEKKAEKPVTEKEKKAEKPAAEKEKKAEKPVEKEKKKPAKKEKVKEKKAEKEEKTEKPAREPADPEVAISRAEEFLTNIFSAMDMDVQKNLTFEDDTLSIELSGDDMGVLIGKRGQTLDSIQYLTSLIVNKGKASYVRVKVDTENYRERRRATLENLAKNIAFKVKKTRKNVYLEPMNPYERRIIHSALQNDPYVTTHSEGEEPVRKVVVTLKKKERNSFNEDTTFEE